MRNKSHDCICLLNIIMYFDALNVTDLALCCSRFHFMPKFLLPRKFWHGVTLSSETWLHLLKHGGQHCLDCKHHLEMTLYIYIYKCTLYIGPRMDTMDEQIYVFFIDWKQLTSIYQFIYYAKLCGYSMWSFI